MIWPIAIAYFETVRLVIAWCEKRVDFRHFRTDRIISWQVTQSTFSTPVKQLRKEWWDKERKKLMP
ncbi:MAG: WYL domain-containing protein [Emcibacteraceae bacterium]|nr:WYL domain-containing protein [Emcibacteraceae bacterium]